MLANKNIVTDSIQLLTQLIATESLSRKEDKTCLLYTSDAADE